MMCDCVAHWRGGPRLEDIILWACWTAAFRKDFLKLWQAQVADSVHHPHRRDGMYIEVYGNFDEQHFASMSASNILYPLFISLYTQPYEVRFFEGYNFSEKFDGSLTGRFIFLPQTYLDNYDAVHGTQRCVGTNVAHCCTRNGCALASNWDR